MLLLGKMRLVERFSKSGITLGRRRDLVKGRVYWYDYYSTVALIYLRIYMCCKLSGMS